MNKWVMENMREPIIEFVGVDNIPKSYRELIIEIADHSMQKMAMRFGSNEIKTILHFKKYKKNGSRQKYAVNGRMFCSNFPLTYSNANEWNVIDATHEVLDSIKAQCIRNFEKNHNMT